MKKTYEEYKKHVGYNIRLYRELRKISVIGLANALGLKNPLSVNNWERGIHMPDLGMVYKMSRILDVSIVDLLMEGVGGG
jgi:transcriptional regulator with XRE-family HTH domain